MTLYERIRKLRTDAGMTQDDLAKAMGYKDRSMITKIEAGRVDISQKKVEEFAKALGTTSAYLMGWEEDNVGAILGQAFEEYSRLSQPKTEEARIISGGIDRMPKEQREQALAMFKLMFAKYLEGGAE